MPKRKDDAATIDALREKMKIFRDERDWMRFHDPKNLAECIAIEAGELLELFLWLDKKDIGRRLDRDRAYRELVADEFADIIMSCLSFANAADIDVAKAVLSKLKKAERKYPVAKARGKATKYDRL